MLFRGRRSLGALLQLILKADLLRAVDAIVNQGLVNWPQVRESGDHQSDPFVMNPANVYGQKTLAQSCAEHHRGSGYKPVLCQENKLPSHQVMLAFSGKAKLLPKRRTEGAVLLIDNIRIREDQTCLRMSHELLLRALKTIGVPDVILVAERDQISATQPNGLLKILCGTQG